MSSTRVRLALEEAEAVAGALQVLLADSCERIYVAGSIRRRAAHVGDIEIVAIPRILEWVQGAMFEEGPVPYRSVDLLARRLDGLVDDGVISRRPRRDGKLTWGPYAKCLEYRGVGVDLFSPERERAGWIVLLRTGPEAFARQLVVERPGEGKRAARTSDGRLGLRPPHVLPRDGWLTERTSGRRIETPTERAAFDALELAYLEPWERR